jgi:formylglycine-generating enzyme required for sulfatase activity
MNRKQIILVALAAVLVAVAGIAVWRLLSPEPVPEPTGLSTPIELVEIQPGEFLMGSPETEEGREEWGTDETQHLTRITYAFKMGKTEVTQKQWREVMGTTIQQQQQDKAHDRLALGGRIKDQVRRIKDDSILAFGVILEDGLWRTLKWLAVGEERWSLYGEGDDHPMYYVNWEEATEFCRRLTDLERVTGLLPPGQEYRLPAEAEWEYACRAGSTTRFANGDAEADLAKIGWYDGNSGSVTHPVGTKRANAWGLHDMHGNVWEWCHDWYEDYPSGEVVDPFGPTTGSYRVLRGGSWFNPSRNCRSAYRVRNAPGLRSGSLGFRVVLAPVRPRG